MFIYLHLSKSYLVGWGTIRTPGLKTYTARMSHCLTAYFIDTSIPDQLFLSPRLVTGLRLRPTPHNSLFKHFSGTVSCFVYALVLVKERFVFKVLHLFLHPQRIATSTLVRCWCHVLQVEFSEKISIGLTNFILIIIRHIILLSLCLNLLLPKSSFNCPRTSLRARFYKKIKQFVRDTLTVNNLHFIKLILCYQSTQSLQLRRSHLQHCIAVTHDYRQAIIVQC